jgi:hypothetical protein
VCSGCSNSREGSPVKLLDCRTACLVLVCVCVCGGGSRTWARVIALMAAAPSVSIRIDQESSDGSVSSDGGVACVEHTRWAGDQDGGRECTPSRHGLAAPTREAASSPETVSSPSKQSQFGVGHGDAHTTWVESVLAVGSTVYIPSLFFGLADGAIISTVPLLSRGMGYVQTPPRPAFVVSLFSLVPHTHLHFLCPLNLVHGACRPSVSLGGGFFLQQTRAGLGAENSILSFLPPFLSQSPRASNPHCRQCIVPSTRYTHQSQHMRGPEADPPASV